MCPKFCTNPLLKYNKCHISLYFVDFSEAIFIKLPKYICVWYSLIREIADSLTKMVFQKHWVDSLALSSCNEKFGFQCLGWLMMPIACLVPLLKYQYIFL